MPPPGPYTYSQQPCNPNSAIASACSPFTVSSHGHLLTLTHSTFFSSLGSLWANGIGPDGAKHVSSALVTNQTLKELKYACPPLLRARARLTDRSAVSSQ